MPDYRTPGVYIEEITATGPIAGVGTSTAAFLGATLDGPIGVPLKVNNWTQFKNTFGDYAAPPVYLPYAVRGFFENGGTGAWIVRVGTGRAAALDLGDRGSPAGKAMHVEALAMGEDGNSISVQVRDAQIVTGASVVKNRAAIKTASDNVVTMNNASDAVLFKIDDFVTVEGSTERAQISRISDAAIQLRTRLGGTFGPTTFLRIADLAAGQKTFRVASGDGIRAGSVITLTQGTTTENRIVDSVADDEITLSGAGLKNSYKLGSTDAVSVATNEFDLLVTRTGVSPASELFPQLSMDPGHSRYFARIVDSKLIRVSEPDVPTSQAPPDNRPLAATRPLLGGVSDNPATVGSSDYQAGLDALTKIDDVSLVCAPGLSEAAVQSLVIDHCETMMDRFAILDSARKAPFSGKGSVQEQRNGLTSKMGYAALYYPWISILDPKSLANDTIFVPPSGHIAGVFARSDAQRGVQKAPANEIIAGAVSLETILADNDQGDLNVLGINAIRSFNGQRPVIWGARTTAPSEMTDYRYVNVRRLLLFIEESIQEGIRWAVFESNDLSLWKKLDRTISEFLSRVWRAGALFGKSASDAFYVQIDEELNTPATRALGQIIISVGVAPVRPAEFVIVRIAMWDGGTQTQES